MDRVLDVLQTIKWNQDESLGLRRSCATASAAPTPCGSTASTDWPARPWCRTWPVRHDHGRADPRPAGHQGPDRRHEAVLRPLQVGHALPGQRRPAADDRAAPVAQEERARFDDTTKCILCACCTTACPPFWGDQKYVGPAAIVNAHRFIFDSRDQAAAERLDILNDAEGVWRCRTVFNCTSACPRDIQVTQAIQEVKRAMLTGSLEGEGPSQAAAHGH